MTSERSKLSIKHIRLNPYRPPRSLARSDPQAFSYLGIKPLQLIILAKDGTVRLPATVVVLLLGVDAVQLGRLVATGDEDAEVDVSVLSGWKAQYGEDMDAVGGLANADGGDVLGGEVGELVVGEVLLKVV